jgi:hypothetical protein
VIYLRKLQNELRRLEPNTLGYSGNGIVTIRTISGSDASVSTQTQSGFKTTPQPLVQDFLSQLQNVPGTLPGVLAKNFSANPADALVAFLNSGKSATVTLGRDLNLTVSPVTLPGASAAELKITLESKDDAAPQTITPDGKSSNDTSDRVAVHSVTTNVRVDALKLFEISTFSAELSRGRDPIPLLPPFVELPYIHSFLKWPLKPSHAFQQSIAIVSATILPTAADMLNGLRFRTDQVKSGDGKASVFTLSDSDLDSLVSHIRDFHRRMLNCIATSSTNDCRMPLLGNSDLTLEGVPKVTKSWSGVPE